MVKIGDKIEIPVRFLYIAWIVLSIVLLYLSSAGTLLFWLFGITGFVIGLHAIFHDVHEFETNLKINHQEEYVAVDAANV